MNRTRIARGLALAAGLMDFTTGLGLVLWPRFVLACLFVPTPGAEAEVYVRFIGAFVASVGASYLWALRRPSERLRVVFGATMLPRGFVGSFTAVAVLTGALAPAWLIVSATDLGLVAAQAWLMPAAE